jgi:FdhD protein
VVAQKPYSRLRIAADGRAPEPGERALASETPVSLSYNGVAYVVMMMTPEHVEDFVLGFSYSESILDRPEELLGLDLRSHGSGLLAAAEIPAERSQAVLKGRRNLVGQAGCGICGLVELEQALRPLPALTARPVCSEAAMRRALADLAERQPLNRETGAVHAAAFADPDGKIKAVREDVGRHNAFDKLIGHGLKTGLDPESGFVLVTSRLSYELVQKAVRWGVPALAAISAPTTLAVDLAKEARLTLAALVRPDAFLVFNDPYGVFSTPAPRA